MNIFIFTGDMLHLASIVIILTKIYGSKSCKGLSLKTQALYALVFVCRYMDLAFSFISLYNSLMKVFFIASSLGIIMLMRKRPYSLSYSATDDNFRVIALLVPCFAVSLLVTENYSVSEVLWTFSILLESVAIVPQLIVVHRYASRSDGFVESISASYVATLGSYRVLYLLGWIYRYATETGYWNPVAWGAGVIQSLVVADFIYYFALARIEGKNVTLPI